MAVVDKGSPISSKFTVVGGEGELQVPRDSQEWMKKLGEKSAIPPYATNA